MFFDSSKGIIALDIDGTITADTHFLPIQVVEALNDLYKQGWSFIFVTGRPYSWTIQTLHSISFPYALAVQNGALLLEMPSKIILNRHYLNRDTLALVEEACLIEGSDVVIYSGLENDDWCYYRPAHFSKDRLDYLLKRKEQLGEKWQALKDFSDCPVSQFSSLKFFAKEKEAFNLSQVLEKKFNLHAPPNRDPFDFNYFVIQATHSQAKKRDVVRKLMELKSIKRPLIVAGDDYNDRDLLQIADVKIVMATAPKDLLEIADIIAPPATKQGIIKGLTEAIQRTCSDKGKINV